MPERTDVCVVGGGAAGLVAAIVAAEAGASVVVLERDVACGRTILATGNGRCNFMHASLFSGSSWGDEFRWGRYNDPEFVASVCGNSFGRDVMLFFGACGMESVRYDIGSPGRMYPLSRQASSVREVLLARAARAGVILAPAREVTGLEPCPGGNGWRAIFGEKFGEGNARQLTASAVVLTTGGGSTLATKLGLACSPFSPVLCSLACAAPTGVSLAALDGRRSDASVRLLRGGQEVWRNLGEVLFRSYGVSGVVIFEASRLAQPGDVIALDLTGGMPLEGLRELVERAGSCAGFLDPAIANALPGTPLEVARMACDLRLVVSGPAEPERAQVTRGGLVTSAFDPATLEARELPGLFAAGEALDVDGDCGGFNLAWAWKSGMVAGAAAARTAQDAR